MYIISHILVYSMMIFEGMGFQNLLGRYTRIGTYNYVAHGGAQEIDK